jgi:hypothetical protein
MGADFSTLKGTLTTAKGAVNFTAKRAVTDSVSYYFDRQSELAKKDKNKKSIGADKLGGRFIGTYGTLNVELDIRAFEKIESLEDQFVGATLTFKGERSSGDFTLEFQNGRIYSETGVIVLVSTNQNVTAKVVLAMTKDAKTNQIKLDGIGYTTSGGVFKIQLAD